MKARLYVKTPWIFKYATTLDVPGTPLIVKLPIRKPVSLLLVPYSVTVVPTTVTNEFQEFKFVGMDCVNEEGMYVSSQ